MRLKEESNNYHASALKRKLMQIPNVVKLKSKKDTKKWCKGKVGVEHDYHYEIPKNDLGGGWRLIPVCDNCGKQDYHDVLYWCNTEEEYFNKWHWHDEKTKALRQAL